MAERMGFPVRWQALPSNYRGGVEGNAGYRVLVLNRAYPFQSEAERRWVVAEELGHAILEHGTLVASEEPSLPQGVREPDRVAKESAAKAFAAELLMPAASVRQAFQREQSVILQALGTEERSHAIHTVVADLARQFHVSQRAMRIRLRELGLLT
jgi:Zn-dependent peptidase ImmA (M78 family)